MDNIFTGAWWVKLFSVNKFSLFRSGLQSMQCWVEKNLSGINGARNKSFIFCSGTE